MTDVNLVRARGEREDTRPNRLDRSIGAAESHGIADRSAVVIAASAVHQVALKVPIRHQSWLVAIQFLPKICRDVGSGASDVPDAHFVHRTVEELRIQARADAVIRRNDAHAHRSARIADGNSVPIPARLRAIEGDGEVMPAVRARPGGVGQDVAREILVMIIPPEEMTHSRGAAQSEAVGLVGRLIAPERHLTAVLAARGNRDRIDPDFDRETAVAAGNAGGGERHVIPDAIKTQDIRPPREHGASRQQRDKD